MRARTLQRIERDRARFIELINTIFEESGSAKRLAMPWPFTKPVLMEWLEPAIAIDRIANGTVDAFGACKTEGLRRYAIPPTRLRISSAAPAVPAR